MTFDSQLALVRDQLDAAGAAVGGAVEEAAGRLAVLLEPALRLALQSALSEAAADLSAQLAGTARVEVRLEGGDPALTATPEPGAPGVVPGAPDGEWGGPGAGMVPAWGTSGEEAGDGEARPFDGTSTRFTLRVPEGLKARVDDAAAAAGVSVNTWFVHAAERALAAATETFRPAGVSAPAARSGRSLSGWIA